MALSQKDDGELFKVFQEISRHQSDIQMADLIWYLDQWGFQPKTEDLEAILRRCDHDADRQISYEEFAEMIGRDY